MLEMPALSVLDALFNILSVALFFLLWTTPHSGLDEHKTGLMTSLIVLNYAQPHSTRLRSSVSLRVVENVKNPGYGWLKKNHIGFNWLVSVPSERVQVP